MRIVGLAVGILLIGLLAQFEEVIHDDLAKESLNGANGVVGLTGHSTSWAGFGVDRAKAKSGKLND